MTNSSPLFGQYLSPFLKWPGGKTAELPKIEKAAPLADITRFLDPFVGGGSVLLAVDPQIKASVNDICPELVHLYQGGAAKNPDLQQELTNLATSWSLMDELEKPIEEIARSLIAGTISDNTCVKQLEDISAQAIANYSSPFKDEFLHRLEKDIPKKLDRIRLLQVRHERDLPLDEFLANVEGSLRSTFYMAVRSRYNAARLAEIHDAVRDADFFFLREYGYASMFRFNKKGEFNIPFGGISYNRKKFSIKTNYLFSDELNPRLVNTDFHNVDFAKFLELTTPSNEDFLFIDPPYDSDFSEYDGRTFVGSDQVRLAETLKELPCKIMIVIGDTPFIRSIYHENFWNIQAEDMHYKWTIKERNERKTQHLTITNY